MIFLCTLTFTRSKFAVVILRGSLSSRIFQNRENREFKNPRKLRRIRYSTTGKQVSFFRNATSANEALPWLSSLFNQTQLMQRGEFHISHDASLHTILSSFRTHLMLSVQQGQLNSSGKRLVLPITLSVPLLCRSIYDFRFTTPNISLVKSKRVFRPPIMS